MFAGVVIVPVSSSCSRVIACSDVAAWEALLEVARNSAAFAVKARSLLGASAGVGIAVACGGNGVHVLGLYAVGVDYDATAAL